MAQVSDSATNRGARRGAAASRPPTAALATIGAGALLRLVQSRRFYENLVVGAIALVVLNRLARENRARALARLAEWDKRHAVPRQEQHKGVRAA